MKSLIVFALLVLSVPVFAQDRVTQTFSTHDADVASASTNLIQFWNVQRGPVKLVSLYGYNVGSQGYLQVFDGTTINIHINGFNSSTETFTNDSGVAVGNFEPLMLTNTVAGLSAGVYYAIPLTTTTFQLAATKADAKTGTAADLTGSSAFAQFHRLPVHTMAIAAQNNYSFIVQGSGATLNRGLTIGYSSTPTTWTAGGTNITALVTVGAP